MRRRDVIPLLGGAMAAWPLAARGQQASRMRRIGVLIGLAESDPEGQARMAAFRESLAALGWIEGRNIQIVYRWSAGDVATTRAYAAELVALSPDVIAVNTPPGFEALRQATRILPIVFVQVVDPIESSVLGSPARPGANITGFSHFYQYAMMGKWLGLLKELAPHVTRVAVIQNPGHPSWTGYLRAGESAAPSLGIQLIPAPVLQPNDINRAIEDVAREPYGAVLVLPDSFTAVHRERIVGLVVQHRLPTIYPLRYFVTSGGLMSYGADLIGLWRGVGRYVDRILQGVNPGDLPVQSSTKFELVINLKAARAIGLDVPVTLLAGAEEVID